MGRIADYLEQPTHEKLLIPFFTAGYPTMRQSLDLVGVAEDSGADFVELGMPFSDPLADGPAIQYSSHCALEKGTTIKGILEALTSVRKSIGLPVILMGYLNPLLAFGESRFVRAAARAGVDGLIVPDLPVEEAEELGGLVEKQGMSMILLVAPTSPRARWTAVDLRSTDFVYAVTVAGVTGGGRRFGSATDLYLRQLRRSLSKPYVAGFGVDSPESAKRLCRNADGVVIGSALVRIIRDARNQCDCRRNVARFLKRIRAAIS